MSQLWTIGHGTSTADEFRAALGAAEIDVLVDVRAHPGSKRHPHFSRDAMPTWLRDAGIGYEHHPGLGGRRRRNPEIDPTVNAGWQNQSFRNYADYTLTAEFDDARALLEALANEHRTAIMCSESVPWRCHRLLIANAFAARGWKVWHLIGAAEPKPHVLGQWGATPRIDPQGVVTYPGED